MFKNLSNLSSLLKQAQHLSSRMQELSAELKSQRTEGIAGGGMVRVEINGAQEVLAVRIEPALFEQHDREMVEDLVTAAVNQALAKSKQMHAEAMRSLGGGMELPGLEEAMARFAELDTPPQPPDGNDGA